jgi:hypothetical protein
MTGCATIPIAVYWDCHRLMEGHMDVNGLQVSRYSAPEPEGF